MKFDAMERRYTCTIVLLYIVHCTVGRDWARDLNLLTKCQSGPTDSYNTSASVRLSCDTPVVKDATRKSGRTTQEKK